jgi:hypothetical protein
VAAFAEHLGLLLQTGEVSGERSVSGLDLYALAGVAAEHALLLNDEKVLDTLEAGCFSQVGPKVSTRPLGPKRT